MSDTLVMYKTVDFSRPMQSKAERNAEWCRLYEEGKSSQEIADFYNVSRERVCQILRRANLIEHKMQRRRLAAELFEQDKAEVRAKRLLDEYRLVEFVRAGDSLATAASKVGFTTPVATWICKKRGIKSSWGRWRDLSARKARIRELVEGGHPLTVAMAQVGEEEGGRSIAYSWVQHNCPELLKKNRSAVVNPLPPMPPVQSSPISVPKLASFEQLEWSDERKARLLELWFNGSSAQQIADIFGDCTRNAVLGQVHRLRMAGKLRISA